MRFSGQTLFALFSLLLCPAAYAEDWPGFRGPTGQGLSKELGLPIEWDTTRNVVWKQSIPGSGWSSPIVADHCVYLTASVPIPRSPKADQSRDQGEGPREVGGLSIPKSPKVDQSLEALCLDSATGKLIWEKQVFVQNGATAPRIQGKNSHASPTPLLHDGRLYVHFGHQGTACLDLSGNIVWRNLDMKYAPVHGNGGSPILVNDTIVFSCDGSDRRFIVALDCQTGKVRWRTERTGPASRRFSFSTPLLITVKGQQQVISPGSDVVNAYDARTGQEIWRVRYKGYSVVPRPLFGHGLIFISTGFDSASLMAIRPDGKGDVTATHVAWTAKKGAPLTPSPLLVDDELYMVSDNGVASCLDALTGKVHWQERLGGAHSASPLFADGRIYCLSEDGVATVLRAGKKFESLARNRLDERILASCAAADASLFIRTEHQLYRIAEQKR